MYSVHLLVIFLFFEISNVFPLESNLKGFDDTILYSVSWPGKDFIQPKLEEEKSNVNFQEKIIQTQRKEKYKCFIPQIVEKEKDGNDKYTGPNPLDLLAELFSSSQCSYKLENYWTYELCHGNYIRQYHEEREGKKVKLQEYFLGKFDKLQQEKLREALEHDERTRPGHQVPVKKVDGLNMPYIQINMTDGTLCDLSSKPRLTKVLYVCYARGKHEIYTLKETAICEYEVIVLSPLLCSHPRYRPQESGENAINCVPLENAGSKPRSLLELEAESMKLRVQKISDGDQLSVAVYSVKQGKDGVPRVRVEILPIGGGSTEDVDGLTSPALPFSTDPSAAIDNNAFNNFIAGRDCIQGGSGWWKYEFCYGKSVTQYHVERDGSKTVVNLGNFIKSGHLKWLADNPHRRPVPGSQLSYYYTKGTICEETGKPRQTEVKLKCVMNKKSPGAVSLYLLEPRTCQYILGVESQLICKLLPQVDEDGLLVTDESLGFSRADYKTGYLPDTKEKKPSKVTILVTENDNLDNHIPDGDE